MYVYEYSILKSRTFYILYLFRYILFILALSEYFCFDKMKYTLEEFFTDVKTFKVSFFSLAKNVQFNGLAVYKRYSKIDQYLARHYNYDD